MAMRGLLTPRLKGEFECIESSFEEDHVKESRLSFEEASRCLGTLGKDETGMRYAYLMITAIGRDLTDISVILSFKHVLFVDVSDNCLSLEGLQVLTNMPFLIMLKAEHNRITSAALKTINCLQVLRLNKNNILDTIGINQPALNHLELSYNQIYMAQLDDDDLSQLKHLELRGNFLPNLGGNIPCNVEVLYLAENRINKILSPTLSKLTHLRILHLRDNSIRKLDGFTSSLVNLKYLNLRKNKIVKFRQFRKLQCLPVLETLIVSENPIAGEETAKGEEEPAEEEEEKEDITRIPILVFLPNLKRINKAFVTAEERDEVAEVFEEKLEEIMAEDSSEDEGMTTTDVTEYTDTD
ncbi:hypothetical protein RN001_010343 [Aquatica leii]|uniref:Leucine-rich repeat-containing protein 23 n=1 Tax=Aquatica leii TaxID=1421715 RepID=A0AAN7PWA6_9COLE|nr:hypothetical protein RN001_010343 [Aquatica leii]